MRKEVKGIARQSLLVRINMIHKLYLLKRSLARTLLSVAASRIHLHMHLRRSTSYVGVLTRLVAVFSPFRPIFDVANVVRASLGEERSRLLYRQLPVLLTFLLLVVDTELDAFLLLSDRLRSLLEEIQGRSLVF